MRIIELIPSTREDHVAAIFVLRLTQFELSVAIAAFVSCADEITKDMLSLDAHEYYQAAKIRSCLNALVGRCMDIR